MNPKDQALINQALQALKINVPYYAVQIKGNQVKLWLYGHSDPVTWSRPARRANKPKPRGSIPRKQASKP